MNALLLLKKVNKNTKQKKTGIREKFSFHRIKLRESEHYKCKSILFSVLISSISLLITTVLVFSVVLSKQRKTSAWKKSLSMCVEFSFETRTTPNFCD